MSPQQRPERIRVAVIESDPLRMIGYRELLEGADDIVMVEGGSLGQIEDCKDLQLVLLATHAGQDMFDLIATVKALRPELRMLLTGPRLDDESILRTVTAGAKGYLEESAEAGEVAEAIRVVNSGSIWAPRRVLAMFVERATSGIRRGAALNFTGREREVLKLLVAGRSNKEIAASLKIEDRTVKAHVARLMRKVGVQNRIALSVHALTRALLE